jgi:hypothetical protein
MEAMVTIEPAHAGGPPMVRAAALAHVSAVSRAATIQVLHILLQTSGDATFALMVLEVVC